MTKEIRHFLIKKFVSERGVGTQEELVDLLEAEGINVTQATISRDIKELNLIKVKDASGRTVYRRIGSQGADSSNLSEDIQKREREIRNQSVLQNSVLEITTAYFLIIIKTHPGLAQGVALCIDQLEWEEIAGTIAGDDTIFIAVKKEEYIPSIFNRLNRLIETDASP